MHTVFDLISEHALISGNPPFKKKKNSNFYIFYFILIVIIISSDFREGNTSLLYTGLMATCALTLRVRLLGQNLRGIPTTKNSADCPLICRIRYMFVAGTATRATPWSRGFTSASTRHSYSWTQRRGRRGRRGSTASCHSPVTDPLCGWSYSQLQLDAATRASGRDRQPSQLTCSVGGPSQ